MVYTVITGFIELPYEQTLVPGVLITNPKKIPSIWKTKTSTRSLFSLTTTPRHIYTLTSWALKRYLGVTSGISGEWVGRRSFRFDLRDNDCLAPNEKTQTSPLSSRKEGFAHPSLPPSPARVRSRVLIQANIPTYRNSNSHKLQYFTRSKPKRFLVITSKAVLPSGSLGKQHSTVIHRLYQAKIPTFHISDSHKLQYFTRSKPKRFLVITSEAVLPSGFLGKKMNSTLNNQDDINRKIAPQFPANQQSTAVDMDEKYRGGSESKWFKIIFDSITSIQVHLYSQQEEILMKIFGLQQIMVSGFEGTSVSTLSRKCFVPNQSAIWYIDGSSGE